MTSSDMFWRFGGQNNAPSFNALLDRSDLTVEEVLEQPSLIEEIKQHNTKLLDYLRSGDVIERLVEIVIAPPPAKEGEELIASQDTVGPRGTFFGKAKGKARSNSRGDSSADREADSEKQRKRVYLAVEILSSEVCLIADALLYNDRALELLWHFLRQAPPLDPIQASNFAKINESLVERNIEETLSFFKSIPDFVAIVCRHVECSVMMDLLLKIVGLERHEGGQGIADVGTSNSFKFLTSESLRCSSRSGFKNTL